MVTSFDIEERPLPDGQRAAAPVRPYAALYVGGMGSREQNFYNALARRMGYDAAAQQVQDAYLARDYAGAIYRVTYGGDNVKK